MSTVERRIVVTEFQDNLLRQAEAQLVAAQQYFTAVASAIIAGHNIEKARVLRMEPGHVLIVELHANGNGAHDAPPG